jgi:hypothetical protein
VATAVGVSAAAPIGPGNDFRGAVGPSGGGGLTPPVEVDLNTSYNMSCSDPSGDSLNNALCGTGANRNHNATFQLTDKANGLARVAGNMGGGFLYYDHVNPLDTDVTITTIYGLDLTPGLGDDDYLMGGVDPVNPQFELTNEIYVGQSQDYDALFLGTFQVGELGVAPQFAGFDVSRFGGDPGARVFVFRATVPYADVFQAVPEPASFCLLVVGLSAAFISRRQRN